MWYQLLGTRGSKPSSFATNSKKALRSLANARGVSEYKLSYGVCKSFATYWPCCEACFVPIRYLEIYPTKHSQSFLNTVASLNLRPSRRRLAINNKHKMHTFRKYNRLDETKYQLSGTRGSKALSLAYAVKKDRMFFVSVQKLPDKLLMHY